MICACIVEPDRYTPILFVDDDPKSYGPFRVVQHNWDATIIQRFKGDTARDFQLATAALAALKEGK